MTATYRGVAVRVYRTNGDRTQIAWCGMLRWVRTSELRYD